MLSSAVRHTYVPASSRVHRFTIRVRFRPREWIPKVFPGFSSMSSCKRADFNHACLKPTNHFYIIYDAVNFCGHSETIINILYIFCSRQSQETFYMCAVLSILVTVIVSSMDQLPSSNTNARISLMVFFLLTMNSKSSQSISS